MAGISRLSSVAIKAAKIGAKLQDGGGLILERTATGGRWTFRYTFGGRRREMGLGSFPSVSLQQARKERAHWVTVLQGGADPISARTRAIDEEIASMNTVDPTFEQAAFAAFEAKKATLRGDGERGR